MSRASTKEEVRDEFIGQLRGLARYWANANAKSDLEKIEGAIFSVLCSIDGVGHPFVSMDLVLRPHPDDKEYFIENEEDFYEDGMVINDDVYLHDLFFEREVL